MRNKNIEALRGAAILMLLFYHYSVSLGYFKTPFFVMLDEAICQFSMIIFFVISGFGTYLHYKRSEIDQVSITYGAYVKQRFKKIAPAYYFCMIFILLFTTGGGYLSANGLKAILIYGTFTQNLFPSVSGDINGVMWTIALFMQFYLISYPLYRAIEKWGIRIYPFFVIFSIICSKILCSFVAANSYPDMYYVIASIRQIFTTIDIFVLGMITSRFLNKKKLRLFTDRTGISVSIFIMAASVLLFIICSFKIGALWGNGIKYYLWKPAVAIVIAVIIIIISPLTFKYDTLLGRTIQFVSKVEYNTYLWHMVLFQNIKNTSYGFNVIAEKYPLLTIMFMILLAVLVGYVSTLLTESPNYKMLFTGRSPCHGCRKIREK